MSDRGASIRIPLQVFRDGRGYLEDRRPNANADPYVVARLMVETVCSAIEKNGTTRLRTGVPSSLNAPRRPARLP